MADNIVTVDHSTTPATIEFSERFNTAVPMIDRHLTDGRGAKVAIRSVDGEVTYGELAERVNRCGNALLNRGANRGDRVLMMIKDCPEFIYVFYGAIKAGIVPVPVNTLLRSADYQYMIADSACTGLLYSPDYAAEVEPALAPADHKPGFVLCTDGDSGLGELIAAASDALDPAPATVDDDCFWLYSSGSTGRPKGTVHRQRDIVETAVDDFEVLDGYRAARLGVDGQVWIPLAHEGERLGRHRVEVALYVEVEVEGGAFATEEDRALLPVRVEEVSFAPRTRDRVEEGGWPKPPKGSEQNPKSLPPPPCGCGVRTSILGGFLSPLAGERTPRIGIPAPIAPQSRRSNSLKTKECSRKLKPMGDLALGATQNVGCLNPRPRPCAASLLPHGGYRQN